MYLTRFTFGTVVIFLNLLHKQTASNESTMALVSSRVTYLAFLRQPSQLPTHAVQLDARSDSRSRRGYTTSHTHTQHTFTHTHTLVHNTSALLTAGFRKLIAFAHIARHRRLFPSSVAHTTHAVTIYPRHSTHAYVLVLRCTVEAESNIMDHSLINTSYAQLQPGYTVKHNTLHTYTHTQHTYS